MWTAAMESFFSYTVKVSMIKTRKLFKTHVPSFQMFVFMFVSHGFEKKNNVMRSNHRVK